MEDETNRYKDLLQLGQGAAASAVVQVSGVVLLYVYHMVLAKFLGANDYGVFSYALVVLNVITVISLLGLQTGTLRFSAAYASTGELGRFKGVFIRSHQMVLVSGFLFVGLFFVFMRFFGSKINVEIAAILPSIIWLIPIMGLSRVRRFILNGLKRVTDSLLPENLILPVGALIFIGTFSIFFGRLDARWALIGYMTGAVLGLLAGWLLLARALPVKFKATRPEYDTRTLLKVSLPMMFTSVWQIGIVRFDQLILGVMCTMSEVGIYSVAVKMAIFVEFGASIINVILAPMISICFHKGDTERLQFIVDQALRWIFIISAPFAALLILLGDEILGFMGTAYVDGRFSLSLLVISYLISAFYGCVGFLLTMTGHQNQYAYVMTLSSLLNIVMNLLLIPRYGINGAAFSALVSRILWNVWMSFIVHKRLGLRAFVIPKPIFLIAFFSALTAFLLVKEILNSVSAVGAFLFIFAGFIYCDVLKSEDLWLLKNIIATRRA